MRNPLQQSNISISILLSLLGAVWWTTKRCTNTADGKLKEATLLFAAIGVLHCWAIMPLSKIKGINLLLFFLYNLAAWAGFHGNALDEMGGLLYFIIPGYVILIFIISQGMQRQMSFKTGKNNHGS